MSIGRRDFTKLSGAAIFATLAPGCTSAPERSKEGGTMYGLIGKMTCVSGQREAFIAILLESTAAMPGCLSYVIARDPQDADAIWITEVWDSKESHAASLQLPAVRDA
ncbi:MAG TPA: antibiotic biosynthesis monooxygenase family protein, partial [Steroidobacteraceae bacterium]|nr:antibiotic biosynthesis monooxygenase family protein [Steroidobacteraceae bacterium]